MFSAIVVLTAALLLIAPSAPIRAQGASVDSREDALETIEDVFRFIQDHYVDEVDSDVLLEGALRGLFDSLEDPHSAYLSAEEMRGLTDTTSGEFGGVGMYIQKRTDGNGYVEVVSPIEDTPAEEAGIRTGDLIMEIDGVSTTDLSIDQAVDRIRGVPGSEVLLTILRGTSQTIDFAVARAIIEVPTVKYAMIDDGIGYLRVIQFTPHTRERIEEAIGTLERAGYESLIVDLRNNPGGLLDSVIDVADLFFSGGLVVGTSSRIPSENEAFYARSGVTIPTELPVVAIINGGSASAAEILAGALRDRDRALLMGETTFGKGSVQQVRRLGAGGFRLTMSRYYTPDRIYIDKVGVDPHVVAAPPELTEAQEEGLTTIIEEELVSQHVDDDPTGARVDRFVASLMDRGIEVDERVIGRMVRDEVDRRQNVTRVFDLDYDTVLNEAIDVIRSGMVEQLIRDSEVATGN